MKKQYRVIDTGKVDWTIEIYHDGELIATEKFYDADEFDERFNELKKAGYEQGFLPEEVQQVKEVYEKKLAKVIGSEPKEKITEEYIKKEDVLKIIYDIKENKDVSKNYGTLIDIIQQVRNLPSENGVTAPLCKLGDTIWVMFYRWGKYEIESRKILSVQFYHSGAIQYHCKDGCFYESEIGKTVFLTREEAERKGGV